MLYQGDLKNYIEKSATGEPTPGGGSVSAVVGGLGTALTNMVHELSVDKKSFKALDEDIKAKFSESNAKIKDLREKIVKIIDEDTTAFDGVMDAYAMPKETEDQIAKRNEAIQVGYKKALEVPLRLAGECLDAMREQDILANYGNKNAITDVGVGIILLHSAIEGALLNVIINLASLNDENFKKETEEKTRKIMAEANELKDKNLKVVYERLNWVR